MSKIPEYLKLIKEGEYPLINDFPVHVNSWEKNLLLSRRTHNSELQELLDHHFISIIWASRLGVFNPKAFLRRETIYRVYYEYPPAARFYAESIPFVYKELLAQADKVGNQDEIKFLTVLRDQFEGILDATSLLYEGEMDYVLRDMLSAFQRYEPNEQFN